MTANEKTKGVGTGLMLGVAVIGVVALAFLAAGLLGFRPYWFTSWADHGPLIGGHSLRWGMFGWFGLWGLLQIVLAVWVGFDAHRRGLNGLLWGLLVLVTQIVGVIVYLIAGPLLAQRNGGPAAVPAPRAAPSPAPTRCVRCGEGVEESFKVCPFCGASLRCGNCDGAIRAGWKVCPHCATPVPTAPAEEV